MKLDIFAFPPLDDLRIDLINTYGNTDEVQSLMEGFIEVYKLTGHPVSISTSTLKINWID